MGRREDIMKAALEGVKVDGVAVIGAVNVIVLTGDSEGYFRQIEQMWQLGTRQRLYVGDDMAYM